MRYRVLNGGCSMAAATGLVTASLAAGVATASVEVRGSIEGLPDGASVEVSLVPAPPLYDLLSAVLGDDPVGLYPVEAAVQALDGRFAFEVDEPGAHWVRVGQRGSASKALLLVGPETDTLLPPVEFGRSSFCTLTLVAPVSAWVMAGRSPRGLRFSSRWSTWPPLRGIEAGKAVRYEFEAGRRSRYESGVRRDYVRLAVGAPGYEPEAVECDSGGSVAVELEETVAPIIEGVLRRNGAPLAGTILVREDGWPSGATDERGRYRTAAGAYTVLGPDGNLDAIELTGGAAELAASAPLAVRVRMGNVGTGRGDLPSVLAAHWSSSGALLGVDRGRPESERFLLGAVPGVARTTVSAEGFARLAVSWSARPVELWLERPRRLEGVTTDLAGDPVGGAEVSISGFGPGPFGVSDGAGRFLVEVAEALGRRRLVARAPGYRETHTDLSDVLNGAAPERIVVEMPPAPAIVGRLVSARGGGVRGTVGLAQARIVDDFIGDATLWNLRDPSVLQVVTTGEDGAFRLDPVDEEHVRLFAAGPGHGSVWRKLPEPVAGMRGDQDLGDVALAPELVLRGLVVDEDGAPVAGATVDFGTASRFTMGVGSERIADVGVDTGGRFRVAGLAPGQAVSLSVRAPGFMNARLQRVTVDASLDAEEVEVRLRKAMELSGRVTDEVTGEGIEGARIRFDQTVPDGDAGTESDRNGDFVLSEFPAGAGVLTARAGGYKRLERSLAEAPSNPLELVLRPEPEIDVLGVVIRDGAPVAGASVSIRSAVSVTDASGRFALKSSPGRASLECRVPGGPRPSRRDIDVTASLGEITIDVTPVTVRGRVTGPDGMPVAAASVHAWRGAGLRFYYGGRDEHRTGPEGDFELQIEPGVYTLMARRDNAQGPAVEVPVVAGDEPYLELTVPAPRLLRARVLGLTHAEALEVGVSVRASFGQGGTMGLGMRRIAGGTEAEPVFEAQIGDWKDATVVAIATVADRSRRAPLQLAPGGATEVDISFADRQGRVEGTVTLDGWPLAGETVFVSDQRRALTWTVQTDHRGAFVIGDLNVGDEISVAAVGERRTVRVTETARVDLEVRTATVRGRLLDVETGLAAGGMRVAAVPLQSVDLADVANAARRRMSTRTAEDGSFVLDGLFAVRYRLEVRPPGTDVSAESVAGSSDVDLAGGDLEVTLAVRAPVDQ